MTQENSSTTPQASIADAYKQLTEAENKAASLEKMLDALDAKMNTILQEAENIKSQPDNEKI